MIIDVYQIAAVNNTLLVFVQDNSTGQGKTGLAFGTAGLKIYYCRYGFSAVGVSLVTQTVNGVWASGGFVEVDPTNMPGLYRLDLPNAAFVAGAVGLVVNITGAGTRDSTLAVLRLVNFDPATNVLETLTTNLVTTGSIGKKIATDGVELSSIGMNAITGYVP